MSASAHSPRSAAEWHESFALFNDSTGLTQRAFCELHGLSHCAFRHRYRLSPLFRGKRRRTSGDVNGASAAPTPSGFRPVNVPAPTTSAAPGATPSVIVRMNDGIVIECLAGADPVAVAALVRELVR